MNASAASRLLQPNLFIGPSQVYKSFFEPHASAYILMQAVAPFAVSASVMFFIKQYPVMRDADVSETARRFRWSYYIVVVLAVYLMLITIVESVAEVGQAWGSTLTGVMLAVLLLPAAIPVRSTELSSETLMRFSECFFESCENCARQSSSSSGRDELSASVSLRREFCKFGC